MSHKITSHCFINCYVAAHPNADNKYSLGQAIWASLLIKYGLNKTRKSEYPQAFYDAARCLMNQWKAQNQAYQPLYPMGFIPLKKKKTKRKKKSKKKKTVKPIPIPKPTPIPIIITIQTNTIRQVLDHKFAESDTILDVKKITRKQLNVKIDVTAIKLYHMTMDCLFEDDKTLKYHRITHGTYTMRHISDTSSNDDRKEPEPKREKVKIDKEIFIKTSETKKNHYATFPTLASYTDTSSNSDEKVAGLTKEILSKEPSGDPAQKDTLLHILDGAAKLNGKRCVFFDSSKGIKSDLAENSYLNAIDANTEDSAKFVVTLKNLDQFVDKEEEKTYDKAEKLIEIKESLANKTYNPIVNDIRGKLAAAHEVPAHRIVIKDVYLNGVGVAYYVKDLTDTEKNRIITKDSGLQNKMQKLFNDYDKCAIHPALFESSYDISMFDELGNKTFGDSDNGKYKVGPAGKQREYIQPSGWTRYGLKVLGKYGDDKWLHPFQDPGNWYRAFHGTTREAGSSIFKGAFRPGSNNAYGVGVYCSPDVNVAAGYCRSRGGTIKLQTKKGQKEFYFVFQVAVNPATMNNPQYIPNFDPSCESCDYWIAPSGADIRPYGILIKEV